MDTGKGTFEIEESRERVTGAIKYVDDVEIGGALHGAFVRLPCARARINSIDAAPALAVPGVVGVYTAADIFTEMPRYGVIAADQPILASGETKFHGDPVAIVLAESHEAARRGTRKVAVDYDVLVPVLSAEDALADGAPLVLDPEVRPQSELKDTNIMYEFRQSWGVSTPPLLSALSFSRIPTGRPTSITSRWSPTPPTLSRRTTESPSLPPSSTPFSCAGSSRP